MTYRIARSGQTFGPYTDAEIRQYIATGNIGLSDLVQAEGSGEWVPVVQLFPLATVPVAPPVSPIVGPRPVYPDPPDFPWWGALLLACVTGGIFMVVWDIVESSWMKRINTNSRAFLLYIGVAVLYLFRLPGIWTTMNYNMFGGPDIHHHHDGGVNSLAIILAIIARFIFRRELLEHYNTREGIGLRLNGFWTLVLGGIYFQYHFNKINQYKRATNRSVPAV